MYETHLPYCLDPHTLETIGLETLNGAASLKAMAAHFRLDMIDKVRCIASVSALPLLYTYARYQDVVVYH